MKNLKSVLLILSLLITVSSFAQMQNEKFVQAVKNGLGQMQASKTPDDFIKASNYFNRIAQAETKEWVPAYYAAYSNLIAGLISTDKTLKDQYWDKALTLIEQADAISSNNTEIYAMKGYIQFMKMSNDPQARMDLMAASAASMAKAKALNPDNPRIYLINGQSTFYTPEAFGGGKSKAKPILETAVAKFAIFHPANETDPNWGAEQAKALLAQCN